MTQIPVIGHNDRGQRVEHPILASRMSASSIKAETLEVSLPSICYQNIACSLEECI